MSSDTMSDGGSIPDLISLTQIPSNMIQSIETDLLEPVVFNQGSSTQDGFCRFTLQNKGFLHSHSKLFMSVEAGTGVNSGFFNPHTGVGQVIKKAVLKIGNKTLNEVTQWNALFGAKSTLIKNENNVEREFYTTGRFMNHGFRYNAGSDTRADLYGLDNGYEYTGTDLRIPKWAEMDVDEKASSPTFSIDLSDLFPFLKVNQLPLYMINEPINIELTFFPTAGDRIQVDNDGGDATGSESLIRRSDLKFCADYVFYNGAGDEMERFKNANQDMSFSFVDYRLIETTVSQTNLSSGIIRNLGMANRMVPRVITALANTALDEVYILPASSNAIAPLLTAGVPGAIKYNIRYNDRFEFSSDVDNTARLFSILTDSEGVPFITREEYSHQKNMITTDTLNNKQQRSNLEGTFFYLGTKLTGGRVGQRGLELHLSGGFPASATTMRNFAEYLRVARLTNGYFEVFNA
jgi:hypothetical protein